MGQCSEPAAVALTPGGPAAQQRSPRARTGRHGVQYHFKRVAEAGNDLAEAVQVEIVLCGEAEASSRRMRPPRASGGRLPAQNAIY